MTRLVNSVRIEIAQNLIAHAFKDRCTALQLEQSKLAHAIYNDVFSKSERDKMYALPDGWLPSDNDICATTTSDTYLRFKFSGELSGSYAFYFPHQAEIRLRFPSDQKGKCVKNYDSGTLIGRRINEYPDTKKTLIEDMEGAYRKAMGTLESYFTVEKLVEAWPEIAPFIPKSQVKQVSQVPALPVSDLNAMFNLPAVEVES